jgi:hypothetical protein
LLFRQEIENIEKAEPAHFLKFLLASPTQTTHLCKLAHLYRVKEQEPIMLWLADKVFGLVNYEEV